MTTQPSFDAAAAARAIEDTARDMQVRTNWPERRYYLAQGVALSLLFALCCLLYGRFAMIRLGANWTFLLMAVAWTAALNLPLLTARGHGSGIVGETPWRETLATRALVATMTAGLALGEAAAWRVQRATGDEALASVLISACVLIAYGAVTACGAGTYGFGPRLVIGGWWLLVAVAAAMAGGGWGYPVLFLGGVGTIGYALLPHARLDDAMRRGRRA